MECVVRRFFERAEKPAEERGTHAAKRVTESS
jgi:hypothetical protein